MTPSPLSPPVNLSCGTELEPQARLGAENGCRSVVKPTALANAGEACTVEEQGEPPEVASDPPHVSMCTRVQAKAAFQRNPNVVDHLVSLAAVPLGAFAKMPNQIVPLRKSPPSASTDSPPTMSLQKFKSELRRSGTKADLEAWRAVAPLVCCFPFCHCRLSSTSWPAL